MPFSLYIHIPFCKSKCVYCDFVSGFKPEGDYFDQYHEAVINEIDLVQEAYHPKSELFSVYFGGGTPSLLKENQINAILEYIRNHFILADDAEITLEANPDDVTPELAINWKNAGINRLSLGFQSMEKEILSFLRRRNSSVQNHRAFEILRKAGFQNISTDVIGSIRGGNAETTLLKIVSFQPEHLSVYQLTLEKGTPLFKFAKNGDYQALSDEETVKQYWDINNILEESGYNRYEISNYAQGTHTQYQSRHNKNYWDYGEYIGVGLHASGFLYSADPVITGKRWTNTPDMEEYFRTVRDGKLPVGFTEDIGFRDAVKEYIMLGLRKTEGINRRNFKKFFSKDLSDLIKDERLDRLNRFLNISADGIRLTDEGINVANAVIRELWDSLDEEKAFF